MKALLPVLVVGVAAGCATAKHEGATLATAVVVDVKHQSEIPAAERAWIERHFPGARLLVSRQSTEKDEEFVSLSHALIVHGGKSYSAVSVQLPDGSERTFYFDISSSFGR